MKEGTENKLKFKQLQRRLGLRLWQARGLLDTLWAFCKANCPAGDIGRFTNEEIAIGLDWEGDHDALVDALVATRWLDEHDLHRLIVHDWHEHCEDTVHKLLARNVALFACGRMPSLARFEKSSRTQIVDMYRVRYGDGVADGSQETPENARERPETPGDARKRQKTPQPKPIPKPKPIPSQAITITGPKPKPTRVSASNGDSRADSPSHTPEDFLPDGDEQDHAPSEPPFPLNCVDIDRAATRAADLARRVPPQNLGHAKVLCRLAIAEQTTLSESFLADALEALRHNRSRNGPQAHFWAVCASKAREELGIDLRSFLRRIPVPSELLAEVRPRVEADTS